MLALVLGGGHGHADAAEAVHQATRGTTCPGPALAFQALAPGLWWLPAAPGDATPENRGQVSNLVLAMQGRRLWLLGSGPSADFGRNLACQVQLRWGRPVTDVISPWPHPELVLGAAGLPAARHWGHADVAAAMQQRCARCVGRLREQLGSAAADLGPEPVRLPQRLLRGSQGRLGPWRWWLLSRGEGFPVTVWQWGDTPVVIAPGLLWGNVAPAMHTGAAAPDRPTGAAAPDARDADVRAMARATDALTTLPGATGPGRPLRWLGEQGAPSAELAAQHQRYWAGLLQAVESAWSQGALETDRAVPVAPVPADDPRHALNWQRVWRQLESAAFQRSLR